MTFNLKKYAQMQKIAENLALQVQNLLNQTPSVSQNLPRPSTQDVQRYMQQHKIDILQSPNPQQMCMKTAEAIKQEIVKNGRLLLEDDTQ